MKYIDDCLSFLFEEKKAAKKELYRLLKLEDKDHFDEGQTIVNAKVVKSDKNGCLLKYPAQFTKLREEKKVEVYNKDKKLIVEAEVISVDYLTHEICLDTILDTGEDYLIILSLEVSPFAIINSLKQIKKESSQLIVNLTNRTNDIKNYGEYSVDNVIKTVSQMPDNSFLILEGAPGAGKTYCASKVIDYLLNKNKSIIVSSNSHSAINNLCENIDPKEKLAAKICSRSNQKIENKNFKNIYLEGKEVDYQVDGFELLAGTCFALARIKEKQYDYLIIDEASQLKMSFLLSVARLAKKVILLGDPNQLQSISIIPMASGGESILDYLMKDDKIVKPSMGYFLNVTYRMEPIIASVISKVFYESKMKWNQKKELEGISLITSNHNHGQKLSKEEAEDVHKIYKKLIKNKVKPEEIMIIAPYNAQVALIKSIIKNKKTVIGSVDMVQGKEAKYLIYSFVSSGNKKESAEFATNPNRVNVAISRAKVGVFLVASKGLQSSEYTSKEFKQIIKIVSK